MSAIKTVAIIGASGNVGAPTVQALLAANFIVTVITRPTSTATFPPNVTVKHVDTTSLSSLTEALKGHDAVVSTIQPPSLAALNLITDAVVASGAKRFVLDEFGVNTQTIGDHPFAVYVGDKAKAVDYANEQAKKNPHFSWTAISTGPFFDWIWKNFGFYGIDAEKKTVTIIDSGNEKWGATILADVAGAVVGALRNLEGTKNKYLTVQTLESSQNELVAAYEKLTGVKLVVERVTSQSLEEKAVAEGARAGYGLAFVYRLKTYIFADGAGHANKKVDNNVVGIKQISVEEAIKKHVL